MKHLPILLILFVMIVSLPIHSYAQESDHNEIDLSLDELLNIEISTATKYNKKASEVPASVSIITSDDIERYGYENLSEVLTQLAGFYTSYDRNYFYLGSRGFSRPTDYNNRIKLLIDGHSMNEGYYGSVGIGAQLPVNFDAIERIEIMRGPGSALYGAGAMFSVINIITKSPETHDGLNIVAKSGNLGTKGITSVFSKALSSNISFYLSGVWSDVEGGNIYFPEYNLLSTNYGIAEGLDWKKHHGYMGAIDMGNFSIDGFFSNAKKGIPTASFEVDFNNKESFTIERWGYLKANYENKLSSSISTSMSINYDHYDYEGTYPYDNFLTTDANWVNSLSGEIQLQWDIESNNRIVSGVEYKNYSRAEYKYWGEDGEIYAGHNTPYNIFSLYVQNEYQAYQNLSLITGIRYDEYSIFEGKFSPRVALVYHPAELTSLKMLYGQAFRMPSLYEAYFEDPITDYRNNLNLKPEEITTYEFVVEQVINKNVIGKVAVYNYKMKSLIDSYEDPIENYFQFQNVDEISANGVEVESQIRFKNEFSGYANYTYEHTHPSDNSETLTNSPSHMFKAGISSKHIKHFTFSADMYYESERKTIYDTETESYVITNLNVIFAPKLSNTSTFAPILNSTKVSLRVKNLFDKEYANPGGYEHIQDKIMQDGRTFIVNLNHQF